MSEQARKVFYIEEQKAKDVLAAIKAIEPVISLIRVWGKTEQELLTAEQEEKRLKEEIDAIDVTIKLLTGDIVGALAEEHDKRCRAYRETQGKCEELREKCKNFEAEVISYQEYVKLYNWENTYIKPYSFETKEEILALLFYLYNVKFTNDSIIKSLFLQKWFNNQSCYYLEDGWNRMLEGLKANKI